MFLFFHRLFNPHCEHCREERQETKVCSSCETLRQQLEIANHEKEKLLERILEKPEPEVNTQPIPVTQAKNIPWNVRRQLLEAEDRVKAKLMRDAPKPIEELEKDLGVAEGSK